MAGGAQAGLLEARGGSAGSKGGGANSAAGGDERPVKQRRLDRVKKPPGFRGNRGKTRSIRAASQGYYGTCSPPSQIDGLFWFEEDVYGKQVAGISD